MSWRLRGDELAGRGDAPALVTRDGAVSYADLATRAASVWRSVRRAGALPGCAVALMSSGRAVDEAVALAGILTSGAVLVPLDPAAPPDRLAAMISARGCAALVHDEAGAGLGDAIFARLDARPGRVVVDAAGRVRDVAAGSIVSASHDHALACVLHTSGSTGTPKAIPITWEGLGAFTGWAIELLRMKAEDRVLRIAELTFDLAWFDHLATLRAGAALALIGRRELAAGRAFADALAALSPSIVYGVPSLFMKLTGALREGESFPGVRAAIFAGEVFPPRELALFAARAPAAALYNFYGPTETNVCTFHAVNRGDLDAEIEVPIGVATPYARCAIAGDDGRAIGGEGEGELVVEGPTTVGGGPYATRDRVRRGADGLFYFRGRIDRMVKVRGYRVEPGEVEAVLAAHPAVRQAAVIPFDDPKLGRTLRGFVAIREGAAATERDLRVHLASKLPPYMVPDRITLLDELPRTATGKVDYARLS